MRTMHKLPSQLGSVVLHLIFTVFYLLLAAVLLPVVGGLCLDQAQVLSRDGFRCE